MQLSFIDNPIDLVRTHETLEENLLKLIWIPVSKRWPIQIQFF